VVNFASSSSRPAVAADAVQGKQVFPNCNLNIFLMKFKMLLKVEDYNYIFILSRCSSSSKRDMKERERFTNKKKHESAATRVADE
jgi:hypothetical protein